MPEDLAAHLRKGRIALVLDHPFLATAVTRLPLIQASSSAWCPSMATDGYGIYFNPEFAASLTLEELEGALAHEVLHAVLGHLDRRGGRDPFAWNIAIDHAVNLLLEDQGLSLPAGALSDPRYRGLAAEEIYESLRSADPPPSTARPRRGGGKMAEPWRDTHLEPDDLRCAGLREPGAPDPEGRRVLRHQLISSMGEHRPGLLAGHFKEEIARAGGRAIDWRALMRAWLTECLRNDWRSFPYSRKHLHRGLFLPSVGLESPSHILFAIDTSGSMATPDLAKAFEEVEALRAAFPCRLTRIQCDAEIQEVMEFEVGEPGLPGASVTAYGRGGTDFRPIFAHAARTCDPSALQVVVVATDGYGTFPERPPEGPVLWLLTRDGIEAQRLPFGMALRL